KPLFVAVSCWNSIAVSTAFLYAVANSCCRFETAWMYCVTFFSASSKYRFTFCLYTAYASFVSVLLIFSPPVVNYFYGLNYNHLDQIIFLDSYCFSFCFGYGDSAVASN